MPTAKYQLADFLATVNEPDRHFVRSVHDMLLQAGYKPKVQVTKTYGLHLLYAQPKIKTVKGIVTYFIMRDGKLMVRINADHYVKYAEVLERWPESIVSQINNADDCIKMKDPQKCWQGCMGYDLHIGGKRYQKCLTNCFLLDVNAESFPLLVEMIRREVGERGCVGSHLMA